MRLLEWAGLYGKSLLKMVILFLLIFLLNLNNMGQRMNMNEF